MGTTDRTIFDVLYSPDDGGWYGEICSATTGATLYMTDVYRTRDEALDAVRAWLKMRQAAV